MIHDIMQGKKFSILAVTCIVFLNSVTTTAALDFKCPADGMFPNPDDCATYISCTGLIPTLMPCAPATLFDPVDKVCKNPGQVNCNAVPSTSTTTPSSPSPTTASTTTPRSTSVPPTTSTGKPSEANCPETGSAVLPNPKNCTSFIVCIEGGSKVVNCPEGYGFNSAQGRCTSDVNDCKPNGSTTPPPSGQPTCPSDDEQRFPNPTDCHSFYVCLIGSPYLITCPVNSQYDSNSSRCLKASSEECGDFATPNPIDQMCKDHLDGALLPDPDDCSKFYQCSHGKALSQTCPAGLLFDEQADNCVTPATANCK